MASVFTKIISGEIPSHKVAEDDRFYAFLDIFPLQKGHTLVVPKQEVDYIFELDDETLATMIIFAKKVAKKIKKTFPCNRVGMTVIGMEIPHAHIHLIPINVEQDMSFSSPKLKLGTNELVGISARLQEA